MFYGRINRNSKFSVQDRVYVRRFAGERYNEQCLVSTVKHGGGSVTIWGWFSGDYVGISHHIERIMTKEVYKDILENQLFPSGGYLQVNMYLCMTMFLNRQAKSARIV